MAPNAARMITALLCLLFATPAMANVVNATSNEMKNLKSSWEAFKLKYGKTYSNAEEEAHRYDIFGKNFEVIAKRNAQETGTATHGVTKFSDLTQDEFRRRMTNYPAHLVGSGNKTKTPLELDRNKDRNKDRALSEYYYYDNDDSSNSLVDWTGVYTTAVKDQGYCGDCWAFSVAEQVESDYLRLGLGGGAEVVLSPQQITDCTSYQQPGVGGCNGGLTEYGFAYAEAGVETVDSYPSTSASSGVTGACASSSGDFVVKVTAYYNVAEGAAGDEAKMLSYVQGHGPLSILVDASAWSSYEGGVLATCGTTVDHAVQVVGVDTSGTGYWIVRNSWGSDWGESGNIYLSYGSDTCALTSDANYCDVEQM